LQIYEQPFGFTNVFKKISSPTDQEIFNFRVRYPEMQKKSALLLLILCLLTATVTLAQVSRKVSGTVMDSAKTTLPGAGVMLISEKDTLKTVTDKDGFFSFSDLKGGNFTLRVAMVGYHERSAAIVFTEKEQHRQLGDFELKASNMMLKEVVIKGKPNPVRLMRDTIEFNADAFRVIEGDNMADLIKQMPGMVVDKDYNVTLMGKQMTKIRVNGKDFFTSDVKEFVKQLPAGIASKIQVIDDYGEEANFTGIKIGEPRKILNIVTRDGINKGSFGNANANTGTNDQAGLGGSVNLWKGNHQTSLQARGNTLNNGAGKNNHMELGLTHSDKLGKNANGGFNYRFNRDGNAFANEQAMESVYPDDKLITNSQSEGDGSNANHHFNGNYNLNNKKLMLNAGFGGSLNSSENAGTNRSNQYGLLRQDLDNSNRSKSSAPNTNGNFSITKKLRNKLSSFAVRGNFFLNNNDRNQHIRTNTLYYNKTTGALEKDSLLNRDVTSSAENSSFNAAIYYMLGFRHKKDTLAQSSLNFNYGATVGRGQTEVTTIVFDNQDLSPSLVDSLSTAFRTASMNQTIGVNYFYNAKSTRFNLGFTANPSHLDNDDLRLGTRTTLNTLNFAPTMNFDQTLKGGKRISAVYNGSTENPTIHQLQPVRNTQNLQDILIGNANLKPAFRHLLQASFNYVHAKSGISFQSDLNTTVTERQIVENVTLLPDTLGSFKQITRYENINGNYQANSTYNLNIPLSKNRLSLGYRGSFGLSNQAIIFNGKKSFGKGFNYAQSLNGYANLDKVSLNLSVAYNVTSNNNGGSMFRFMGLGQGAGVGQIAAPAFFRTKNLNLEMNGDLRLKNFSMWASSSFQRSINERTGNAPDQDQGVQGLPATSELSMNTTGRLTIRKSYFMITHISKRINYGYALTGQNPLIINLTVEKAFLKNKVLFLSASANDLLGQGNNLTRMVSGNTVIDSRTTQPRRVFLLNLGYKLSRFGGKHYQVDPDY